MEGGLTSPTGIFMLIIAFICDLISLIPWVGPIISIIIISGLLFALKDQLGYKKPQKSEPAGEKGGEPKKDGDVTTTKSKPAELPKKEGAKGKKVKATKGSMAQDLAKGDIKGIAKRLLFRFLIKLIPIIGPIVASYTVLIWGIVK